MPMFPPENLEGLTSLALPVFLYDFHTSLFLYGFCTGQYLQCDSIVCSNWNLTQESLKLKSEHRIVFPYMV